MAFAAFADAPVDVAVVEVGMGGSWDATNVADGDVAVVTPISVDHANYLGARPQDIAREKAGIIKPGATVVSAAQAPEVAQVLVERARRSAPRCWSRASTSASSTGCPRSAGRCCGCAVCGASTTSVFLPLYGAHQAQNAVLALAAVEAFTGEEPLDTEWSGRPSPR